MESQQRIAFARSKDGVNIAYALSGEGPPLVRAGTWLTHLQHDWNSVLWTHWFSLMSAHHTLVRYDPRGNGLSQRDGIDISLQHWVDDLACVVDKLELESFPLFGMSQGAGVAIAYALQHPGRVSHLTLYAPAVQGWHGDHVPAELADYWRHLSEVTATGWGAENLAFTSLFAQLFVPDAPPETIREFARIQQQTAAPEVAQQHLRTVGEFTLLGVLKEIDIPTVVIQVARDQMVPPELAAGVAALIPGADFISLDSANHILLETEPAWAHFRSVFSDIYGTPETAGSSPADGPPTAIRNDLASLPAHSLLRGAVRVLQPARDHGRRAREIGKPHTPNECLELDH